MEPKWNNYEEAAMPSMTLKSIPDEVYRHLKSNARMNHRSLNGEAIACLERSLGLTRQNAEEALLRADALRNAVKGVKLTDRLLRAAKSGGRL
jgi:plasmid stability protein